MSIRQRGIQIGHYIMDTTEKNAISEALKENYFGPIARSCDTDIDTAKILIQELFIIGVKQGLTIQDIISILTEKGEGILDRLGRIKKREDIMQIIDYIKQINAITIYKEAEVPFERDFIKDEKTGRYTSKV